MGLCLFSPITARAATAMIPPPPLPEVEVVAPLSCRSRRLRMPSFRRSRCSRVRPPANRSKYFDPCSAMRSGITVMATFWSRPLTICGATMSLLSSSSWIMGRLLSARPNEIGSSPKPRGMITAIGAFPSLTAVSTVAAVYSGCSAPLTGSGRVFTTSEPSCFRP